MGILSSHSTISPTILFISRAGPGLIKCDLTDLEAVKDLIEKEKPNFIIHAAAERFPDVVEKKYEKTRLLNIKTAGHIASVARKEEDDVLLALPSMCYCVHLCGNMLYLYLNQCLI